MPDRPLDGVDLKVANTIMAGVAEAYGYDPDRDRGEDDAPWCCDVCVTPTCPNYESPATEGDKGAP